MASVKKPSGLKPSAIYKRATNPRQFDLPDAGWPSDNPLVDAIRQYWLEYLLPYQSLWTGADIFEIGCGDGWLLDFLKRNGSSTVEGLDPSIRAIQKARESYPTIPIHRISFESFPFSHQYDLILSLLVFSHIPNLDIAFAKIKGLLKPRGTALIMIPDFEYYRSPRGYDMQIETVSEKEYLIQVNRPEGIIADIIRKVEVYQSSAEAHGLSLVERIEIKPTETLMLKIPRYRASHGKTMHQLLRFERNPKIV